MGPSLLAFCTASVLLAVTPGPGVVYIVTRTLGQGRAAGFASVAGIGCGNALNALGAALGLAALFGVWSGAFLFVKYAGAAYLVWLGVRMWRSAGAPGAATPPPSVPVPLRRLWRDGLVVALLNPKTTLFFAAFLPQFMDLRQPALPQAIGLGALFVAIAATTDVCWVLIASTVAPALASRHRGAGRIGARAGGASLVVLGVLGATTGSAPGRHVGA